MYQVRTSGFEYYIEYWFERIISYNLRKKKKFPTHLRPLIKGGKYSNFKSILQSFSEVSLWCQTEHF